MILNFFIKIYNLYLSKDKNLARTVYQMIGVVPTNLYVFKLAFSHKSNNKKGGELIQNNERLEYLGDAILGSIVAEYLFSKYPHGDEGFLTKMRSKIVKRKSLNLIADRMGLDVVLSDNNNTRISVSMLGNALEALIGAIYIDLGYKKTSYVVVDKILRNYVDIHELEHLDENYKSQLLEHCQKNGKDVSYQVIARFKQDKRDKFKVAVMIDDKKMATAEDFNKKSAEQIASRKTLIDLGIIKKKKLTE